VNIPDDLTVDKRRYLATHARYASEHQKDPRYWDPDPTERERLQRRWREIADTLHPDPWGPPR
jgi:DNA mismatch repair protein MutH